MLPLLAACVATDEESTLPTLEPPPEGEGFQGVLQGTAPPLEETWLCSVYDLSTDETSAVNRVEFLQNAGTHHMTLSTTALSDYALEPGMHDCADLYADPTLMEEVVMMFGNQGEPEGTLQLPEGVVAWVPPGIQVLHEVHFVNTTEEPIELYSYVNAWTIDGSAVVDSIWGGQVRDETLSVPAGEDATEWTRCVMNEDVDIHFLASHTHALATSFTIAAFDGTSTGEVFYTNEDWHDPKLVQYSDPLAVPQGQGFEYTCHYRNESAAEVNYGYLSTDEMCNMTLIFTPGSTTAACDVVETSDGVLWP